MHLERNDEAVLVMWPFADRNRSDSEGLNNLSIALARILRMKDALEFITQAIKVEPMNAFLAYNRGIMLYLTGAFGKALQNFDLALRYMPASREASNNRAACLLKLGRVSEATRCFDKASRLKSYSKSANSPVYGDQSEVLSESYDFCHIGVSDSGGAPESEISFGSVMLSPYITFIRSSRLVV